jgi:hypothetical protein
MADPAKAPTPLPTPSVPIILPADPEEQPGKEDMHDTRRDIRDAGVILGSALDECKTIEELYIKADQAAMRFQKSHQATAKGSAVFGGLALALATISLALLREDSSRFREVTVGVLGLFELIFATWAIFLVSRGVLKDFKEHWLVERHRAERCRLLKFAYLTDPLLWTGRAMDRQLWSGELDSDINEIKTLGRNEILLWLTTDAPPAIRRPHLAGWPNEAACESLLNYYWRKRLKDQMDYFDRKSRQHEESDHITRRYPSAFFFGGVVFVFLHLLTDSFKAVLRLQGSAPDLIRPLFYLNLFFLICAALLPAIGAGVRTYRMAHEFARNTTRFKAKHSALCKLRRQLAEVLHETPDPAGNHGQALSSSQGEANAVLRELGFCEYVLDSDHREWLRLMIDAEWFG